jgi:2-dehydropantoate 2-reductase
MAEPKEKRVIVLGGGAVGSVVAAALSEKWANRLLLVGRKDHVRAIREGGLELEGESETTVALEAAERLDFSLADCLVIVTTKATGLQHALEEIKAYLREDTLLLLLQNGYGIKALARQVLRDSPVKAAHILVGLVAVGATFIAPGRVRRFKGSIRLDPGIAATAYRDLFSGTFILPKISTDLSKDTWTKLAVNAVVNPLSVLLKARNRVVADPVYNNLKASILEEVIRVAAGEGVALSLGVDFVNRFRSDNFTSMYQDIARGRKTEIDFINGAIVRLAETQGIDVPVNRALVALIRALESASVP